MAKKKEKELSYMQMPLPSSSRAYKYTKVSWAGLNRRQTIDTGELSMESNISTAEAPYLTPSPNRKYEYGDYEHPIGMFGFDDFLIVIYRLRTSIFVDYITKKGFIYTGLIKIGGATADDDYPRSVVQFNVYDVPTDPVDGKYIKKLLFFPDKVSMFMNIVAVTTDPTEWSETEIADTATDVMYVYHNGTEYVYYTITHDDEGNRVVTQNGSDGYFILDGMDVLIKGYFNDKSEVDKSGATVYPPPETASHNYYYKNNYNQDVYRYCEYDTVGEDGEPDGGTTYGWKVCVPPAMPNIKYATVHLSRLFGVDDDRVYASGYNDYTNWNLDSSEYNESNAWCSPAQSNTKAGGVFTGITTFQSHVICFKKDFMHELYNTKNPFRIQDIYAEGAIDNRTIQDVDGSLIFVSEDDVKIYTGSNPRIIGYNLNMGRYEYAVSGTDGRCYYLYCEEPYKDDVIKHLFVYDTYVGEWSEQSIDVQVLSFAHNKNGMYMLCADGYVYKMDTTTYAHDWSFETDLITKQSSAPTINIKHIKKIQMLTDIAEGAHIKVYFLYDDEEFNEETSHLVYSSTKTGRVPIRVKPRKTAHYGIKVHVEGYGFVRLYELELLLEHGGDLYA